jgi:hypothetical protein
VEGKRHPWAEKMKSLDARDRSLQCLFISIIFSLASLFTLSIEAISRIREGRFSLRGFGFLCPAIAYGTFMLSIHYSKHHLYHDRLSLILDPSNDPEDPLTNLDLMAQAARRHFEKLKSDINKYPACMQEALPLLIKLHFLQKHCINLMQPQAILAEKIEGHYPTYSNLFSINADFLSAPLEKKQEMVAKGATLATTKDGKSLSFDDLCKEPIQ